MSARVSAVATDSPVVIAMGQMFSDLKIEQEELAKAGARIVDGRTLAADDPLWSEASGILLGTAARLDAAAMARLRSCKGVVRYGVGYDNVDVDAAKAHGIVVAIVREYCVDEVAEHALAFALSLARGLPRWDRTVRAGDWRGSSRPSIHRLSALSFGVIGFGLIGRAAASRARCLFGRVLVHDAWVTPTNDDIAAGYAFVHDLETLLSQADIVTVHLPLTPKTRGLINAESIKLMKPSAFVINVSRGGIVEESAVLEAVRIGRIAGAALDTFEREPLADDHPLLAEPGIMLSPHVAWISDEAEIDLRRLAAAEIGLILQGRKPTTPVTS